MHPVVAVSVLLPVGRGPACGAAGLALLPIRGSARSSIATTHPIVDLPTGHLIGLEALQRWRSPTRGSVPTLDFIPIAQDSGLICDIGAFVLGRACRQLATWNHHPAVGSLRIWVNIPRRLEDAHFADTVEAILAEAGLDRKRVRPRRTSSPIGRSLDRVHRSGER